MDIKKFQLFLLAKKRESALGLPILALQHGGSKVIFWIQLKTDVYFKQHLIHVCPSKGASCEYFALTIGEKKFARKYPERFGCLYTDKKIERYEKWN